MENGAQNQGSGQRGDHWDRLDGFLHTDPRDTGCDVSMDMLHIYAELIVSGKDPVERFPGIRAHILACGPCAENLEGLLEAIAGAGFGTPDLF